MKNDMRESSTDHMSELQKEFSDLDCSELTLTEQRSLIFQILYAIDAFEYQVSLESIVDNFYKGFGIIIPHTSAVFHTASAVSAERDELDKHIVPLIENWRFDRLGVSTKLILRLAVWELLNTSTDAAAVINEAVELGKCFAEKDAYKFINGILDEFLKKTNPSQP